MDQVHGANVLEVRQPGRSGEGDALVTTSKGLPLAVRTADCVPLVVHGEASVAVVHAGWRGLAARVIERAREALGRLGRPAVRAVVGPAIGPCCYEVGDEVVAAFDGRRATTTWGTQSVDLWSEAAAQLSGLDVIRMDLCTKCEAGFHSYRAGAGSARQTSLGWL